MLSKALNDKVRPPRGAGGRSAGAGQSFGMALHADPECASCRPCVAHALARAQVQERRAMRGLAAAARLQGQYRSAIKHLERVLEISREMREFTGEGPSTWICMLALDGPPDDTAQRCRGVAAACGVCLQVMLTRTARLRTAGLILESLSRRRRSTTSTSRGSTATRPSRRRERGGEEVEREEACCWWWWSWC